jgi:photosystem II stability/assembly factor-like uncharacterized protein
MRCLILAMTLVTAAHAQWTLQHSGTGSSLRGIHNVGSGVVWASGTGGTVLRTIDSGKTWQTCAVPPKAEQLDFRGIQAFDENTAIVMSSGTGPLSRLYKTTNGCRTWKLVLTNPDETGFWDALQFSGRRLGVMIGDQVRGHFPVFTSRDGGDTWQHADANVLNAVEEKQSIFAASNTSLLLDGANSKFYFVTGGGATSFIAVEVRSFAPPGCKDCLHGSYLPLDLATGETAGGFSLGSRVEGSSLVIVAVGGDYKSPDRTSGTAAFRVDDHRSSSRWHAADTPPHGYRSAVAWYEEASAWIAVGPNGTDISTDDGRNWRALKPASDEAQDADKNWNALSLPFAVGPRGRIGKLRAGAVIGARK